MALDGSPNLSECFLYVQIENKDNVYQDVMRIKGALCGKAFLNLQNISWGFPGGTGDK